jgi:hypothetical protein
MHEASDSDGHSSDSGGEGDFLKPPQKKLETVNWKDEKAQDKRGER